MALVEETSTVVIAIDKSTFSEQAFDYYFQFLHKPLNKVALVHIPEVPTVELSKGIKMSDGELQEMKERENKETNEIVEKFSRKISDADVSYHTAYSSKVGSAIVEKAKELNACYIVLGARGLSSVMRTFMGSVSDYVVHHAGVPVLVVRHNSK